MRVVQLIRYPCTARAQVKTCAARDGLVILLPSSLDNPYNNRNKPYREISPTPIRFGLTEQRTRRIPAIGNVRRV